MTDANDTKDSNKFSLNDVNALINTAQHVGNKKIPDDVHKGIDISQALLSAFPKANRAE